MDRHLLLYRQCTRSNDGAAPGRPFTRAEQLEDEWRRSLDGLRCSGHAGRL